MASKSENRKQTVIIIVLIILLIITNVLNGAFAFFTNSLTQTHTSQIFYLGQIRNGAEIYPLGTNAENIAERTPTEISFTEANDLLPGGSQSYTLKIRSNSTISTCLRLKVEFHLQLNGNSGQYTPYTFTTDGGRTWQQFIQLDMIGFNGESYQSVVQDKVATDPTVWTSSNNNGEHLYYNSLLTAGDRDFFFDFKLSINESFGSRMEVGGPSVSQQIEEIVNRNYKIVLYVDTCQATVVEGQFAWDEYTLPTNWLNLLDLV